jgi:hypothetical protein
MDRGLSRNTYERRYLEYVGRFCLDRFALRKADSGCGYFVMEYSWPRVPQLEGSVTPRNFEPAHATAAARILGQIHRFFGDPDAFTLFGGHSCFDQLRLSLTFNYRQTASETGGPVQAEATPAVPPNAWCMEISARKNILIGADRMVILDCEGMVWRRSGLRYLFHADPPFLKRSSIQARRTRNDDSAPLGRSTQVAGRTLTIGPASPVDASAGAHGRQVSRRVPDRSARAFVRFVYAHLPASNCHCRIS